jgi:uncharacterized membrane protein
VLDGCCTFFVIASNGKVAGICTPAGLQPVRVITWDTNDEASVLFEHTDTILPTDINEAGTIVGQAVAWGTQHRTFAWAYEPDGGVVELPGVPTSYALEAYGINDAGEIVGTALTPNPPGAPRRLALRWTERSLPPSVLPTPFASPFASSGDVRSTGARLSA